MRIELGRWKGECGVDFDLEQDFLIVECLVPENPSEWLLEQLCCRLIPVRIVKKLSIVSMVYFLLYILILLADVSANKI